MASNIPSQSHLVGMTTGVLNTNMLIQRTGVSTEHHNTRTSSQNEQERRCDDTLRGERDHAVEGMCTFSNGSDRGDYMNCVRRATR